MLYREAGQFRTSYAEDQQLFPIRQDRIGMAILLVFAFVGILENGRIVMDGIASELAANEDVKEFYLGLSSGGRRNFKDVKHYRRRKRWLA